MIHKSSLIKGLIVLVFILISASSSAQQDPQYTHYMYNTLSVIQPMQGKGKHLVLLAYIDHNGLVLMVHHKHNL